jgi:hypothetical protein
MTGTQTVDATRCPLCGKDNACGAERGAAPCWCFSLQVPGQTLEQVAPALRNRACLCRQCAQSGAPAEVLPGPLTN